LSESIAVFSKSNTDCKVQHSRRCMLQCDSKWQKHVSI